MFVIFCTSRSGNRQYLTAHDTWTPFAGNAGLYDADTASRFCREHSSVEHRLTFTDAAGELARCAPREVPGFDPF